MSTLLDDLLDGLEHADYDPVKAREYYLRTRELKGRQKGFTKPAGSRPTGTKRAPAPPSKKAQAAAAAKRRAATKARVNALNERLDALRKVLRELVEQAKSRSGVPDKKAPPSKAKAPVKKATSAGSEKLTAAQKKDAAKRAKELYEKEKGKSISGTDQEKILQAQVEDVQKKITKARQDLLASIQRAKQKKTSKNPAATSRRNS